MQLCGQMPAVCSLHVQHSVQTSFIRWSGNNKTWRALCRLPAWQQHGTRLSHQRSLCYSISCILVLPQNLTGSKASCAPQAGRYSANSLRHMRTCRLIQSAAPRTRHKVSPRDMRRPRTQAMRSPQTGTLASQVRSSSSLSSSLSSRFLTRSSRLVFQPSSRDRLSYSASVSANLCPSPSSRASVRFWARQRVQSQHGAPVRFWAGLQTPESAQGAGQVLGTWAGLKSASRPNGHMRSRKQADSGPGACALAR